MKGIDVLVLWAVAAILVGLFLPAVGMSEPKGWWARNGLLFAAASVLVAAAGTVVWLIGAIRRWVRHGRA